MTVSIKKNTQVTNYEQMNTEWYFQTPVYTIMKPEWVSTELLKLQISILKKLMKIKKSDLKERKKFLGNKNWLKVKDHGMSYHSTPLNGDPDIKELQDYVGATSNNLLNEWGYDMKQYSMFFTEFWVQEFSKNGGGHHDTHVHWDNHISGFYFLKCSEYTSYPVFHDPRAGAMMTKLPQKDMSKVSPMSDQIHFIPKPGHVNVFSCLCATSICCGWRC